MRTSALVAPYHLRLDWQMWFAAMGDVQYSPWILSFIAKLLQADALVLGLLAYDPFAGRAPRYVRVRRFVYRFAPYSSDAVWSRVEANPYLPPLSLETPEFKALLQENRWGPFSE